MDYQFPRQLFPSFYSSDPPNRVQRHSAGGWGCYHGVLAQGGTGSLSSWAFTSKRQLGGEVWRQTEPVPVPLLSPRKAFQEFLTPPDPLDFLKHMQNFYMDHGPDAFGCMSEILGENFYFKKAKMKEKYRKDSVNMWRTKCFVDQLKFNMCPMAYRSRSLDRYCSLLWDVVHDVPPELLGSLLHEELAEQRDRMQFSEAATGGALAFVPFSQGEGCLLYPRGPGMDRLNFHRVALERDGDACVDAGGRKPVGFQLKAPVRQISCGSRFGDSCVAVRTDHVCGVWGMREQEEPRLLQVVGTRAAASCVSVSPHILGEVLVASESGAANLWTVGRGMQEVRTEESNLYFNAKSSWRWCEFSAHPRVMLYADRTGVELTDFRVKLESNPCHTLFRISSTSDCQSGERLLLVRFLGDVHPFHHLLTTQHSAYIMDERFPGVPMLKWDHMMEAPPLFCHVAPGSASGTTKVLLGSQSSQEITLLQYSGGRVEACCSHGSPQVLLRPRDSLALLPVQIPHRQQTAAHRLASPAAGLTCLQKTSVSTATMIVLQLTAAGDVFYQILERDDGKPGAPETGAPETGAPETGARSPLLVAETSSDEDVVMPTQDPIAHTFVPETPDRNQSSDRLPDQVPAFVAVGNEADWSAPSVLSSATRHAWRRWLQKLRRREGKPGAPPHLAVRTAGLLSVAEPGAAGRHMQGALQQDLQRCMRTRSLLLNRDLDPVPVPPVVDAEAWCDPLSDRLTAAWRGGTEAWLEWWQEERGENRAMKKEALRRRRRREKEAQRAAGSHLRLSGSFTSSISYQTDVDDFSGWSSGTSGPLSDSQRSRPLGRLAAFLEGQDDSPPPDRLDPPSRTPEPQTANQRSCKLADQSLSSLWETQVGMMLPPPGFRRDDPPLHPAPSSSSSQLPSFTSLMPSKASQSQRGALQASQPKKKKSRMGF
ncbi:TATA box-binding protein-associated factor, RNA polymerase I, subunit C isoform X2 [Xiphophorus couchianus]|uniref:TATA box-binding protein-associated factor, RNA polymerase I, subunit C isoform X2 n=1 Tax=Xiphophorus couchianus TaxID=32473 RepID=UPI001016E5B4|nr:TATA box-binding protein-associated factor RNA polymerase I subunit C isoform X2 [Xiphophorus couchianus]